MDVLGNTTTITERLLTAAVQANRSGYAAIRGARMAGKNLLWGNIDGKGQGPTPEQAVALLGTDAAKWFQVSDLSSQILAVLDGSAPELMPAGWSCTVNSDGTVTLVRPAA